MYRILGFTRHDLQQDAALEIRDEREQSESRILCPLKERTPSAQDEQHWLRVFPSLEPAQMDEMGLSYPPRPSRSSLLC